MLTFFKYVLLCECFVKSVRWWSLKPITVISVEHPNTVANQRCLRICVLSAQMLPKSVLLTTLDWFKWQTSSLSSCCIYFLPLYGHLSMSTVSTLVLVVVWPSIELVLDHVWNCVLRHVVGLSRNWWRPAKWQGTSHWGRGMPRHWSVHTVKVRTIAWDTKRKCIN